MKINVFLSLILHYPSPQALVVNYFLSFKKLLIFSFFNLFIQFKQFSKILIFILYELFAIVFLQNNI